MHRLRLVLMLLVVLPAAAQAQSMALGSKLTGKFWMGEKVVPLLDGEWTVVATGETADRNHNVPIGRMMLAQLSGNRLARWVSVSTNLAYGTSAWTRDKEICDRKNVHAGYSDQANNLKETSCWVLNHVGMSLGNKPSQVSVDFYRWSDAHHRPNTALGLQYYLGRSGNYLRIAYYFNPVVEGFRDTDTAGWRGNPWHVDVAAKDPKKLAYLRQLKTVGEDLLPKVQAAVR